MKCSKCGAENREKRKFCAECGAKLGWMCPQCGFENEPNESFCGGCGHLFDGETSTRTIVPRLEDMRDRLHIPEPIKQRMEAAEREIEGENRLVTALFADISGFTPMSEELDTEAVVEKINQCFRVITNAVYRYEGSINRFIGDCVLAFFGAPLAHENDPERAILAALDMQEGTSQLGLSISIGINTGMMYFGPIGTQQHLEITAYGRDINLAKRLQESADPGQILVGPGTYHLTGKAFNLKHLDALILKGIGSPVSVYEVLSVKEHPERLRDTGGLWARMVGREQEFADLKKTLDNLLRGQGQIVCVIGEAGIGKSRLMAEIRRDVLTEALYWLEGRALSFGQSISYWPFQEILWQYAGITEDDSEEEAWRRLEAQIASLFGEDTIEILPYLASLLSLEVRGKYEERVKYLNSEAMGRQVFLASRRFFQRLAQSKPLVLVFEDLHWVDESTARLLEHLLPLVERVPLLICCVSRLELRTQTARLREISAQDYASRYTEIVLSPLSQTDSAQLMRDFLDIEGLTSRVRDTIIRRADGNPFFLEEIIRSLIDAGAMVRDTTTGRWQATAQIEAITIPDTIQGVIMARVDRLDKDVKQVLRTAAIIGRSFLYRVLRAIRAADKELDRNLAELQVVEFIRERRRLPELEYIFKHALAQEATYESILLQKRRELHAQVGQVIETLFADRLEEFYGLLAYHYARSEAWEKAQEYLLKAGDQAGRVAADAEALTYYEQAFAAYAHAFGDQWDPLQRASLERKIGEALLRRGEHTRALEHLHGALTYLGKPLPTSRWGVRLAIMREIAKQIGHRLLPRLFVKPVDGDGSISPVVEEEIHLYEAVEWIEGFANHERFLLVSLKGLNVSERSGFHYGVAESCTALGLITGFIPIFWLAGYYHRRAMALAEQIQQLGPIGLAHMALTYHNFGICRWDTAIVHGLQAIGTYRHTGDLRVWGMAALFVANTLTCQNDFTQALAYGQDLVRLGEDGADHEVLCWGLSAQGFTQLRMGRLDEAIANLNKAIELAEAVPDHRSRVTAGGRLGQCYLRQAKVENALSVLEENQRFSIEHRVRGYPVTPLRNGLAEVYLAAVEQYPTGKSARADWLKRAGLACRAALKHARNYRGGLSEAMMLQGRYEWLSGKHTAAQKWWQRSLALAEEMGQRYDLAITYLEMGERLGEREHLERAEAIFAEIGAEWELARARDAL